jgi:hypothetical protein
LPRSQFKRGECLFAGPAGEQILGAQPGPLRFGRGGLGGGLAASPARSCRAGELESTQAAAGRVARKADHRPHFTLAVAAPHGRSPVGIRSGGHVRAISLWRVPETVSSAGNGPGLRESPLFMGRDYHDGGGCRKTDCDSQDVVTPQKPVVVLRPANEVSRLERVEPSRARGTSPESAERPAFPGSPEHPEFPITHVKFKSARRLDDQTSPEASGGRRDSKGDCGNRRKSVSAVRF